MLQMECIDLNQLRAVLLGTGECVAASYLKENPPILCWTICQSHGVLL
jgi:hypothetical protein